MTAGQKQRLFVWNIHKLIEFAYAQGFEMSFGEVFRTAEQQKIYFETGRSKTMDSRHLLRLAVDFNFFRDGEMLFAESANYIKDATAIKPLGDYWVSLHTDNVWGGDWNRNHDVVDEKFRDPYHFEMKP